MEVINCVLHAFLVSSYTMESVILIVQMELLKIPQQKHVNFVHQIVPLVKVQQTVFHVQLIFIFIWVNAQFLVLFLHSQLYQIQLKSVNNVPLNAQNVLL